MLTRVVKVIQRHELGIQEAKNRLRKLGEANRDSGNVKLIDFSWSELTHQALFTVSVYGQTVHGRVQIGPETVELETDQLPFLAVPFVWYAQSVLQAKLADALKP